MDIDPNRYATLNSSKTATIDTLMYVFDKDTTWCRRKLTSILFALIVLLHAKSYDTYRQDDGIYNS